MKTKEIFFNIDLFTFFIVMLLCKYSSMLLWDYGGEKKKDPHLKGHLLRAAQ